MYGFSLCLSTCESGKLNVTALQGKSKKGWQVFLCYSWCCLLFLSGFFFAIKNNVAPKMAAKTNDCWQCHHKCFTLYLFHSIKIHLCWNFEGTLRIAKDTTDTFALRWSPCLNMMIKGHVIAVALPILQTNYKHLLRGEEKMYEQRWFCNTCKKVLLTVKNMHTPKHHHWRRIVCERPGEYILVVAAAAAAVWASIEKFCVGVVFIFRSSHPRASHRSMIQWILFKSQFITCWSWNYQIQLRLSSPEREKKKMIQLQIWILYIFFWSPKNEIKNRHAGVLLWGEISICCRFCC